MWAAMWAPGRPALATARAVAIPARRARAQGLGRGAGAALVLCAARRLGRGKRRCAMLARGGEAEAGFNSAVGGRLRVRQILEALWSFKS